MYCFCIFFFKQKTAYEMRISDWSSDVCSSDLISTASASPAWIASAASLTKACGWSPPTTEYMQRAAPMSSSAASVRGGFSQRPKGWRVPGIESRFERPTTTRSTSAAGRTEEHTSELQALMPTSYAAFSTTQHSHQH